MGWRIVPYLLCCWTMSAQIDHIATTSDGSVLYFSANLKLTTSNHQRFEQIFRYNAENGTFDECIDPQLAGHPDVYHHSATRGFGNPDVTADGALVAFDQFLVCTGENSQCLYAAYTSPVGKVQTPDFPDGTWVWIQAAGNPRISPNGKYVLSYGTVTSLADGTTADFSGSGVIPSSAQAISDDGSILTYKALVNKTGSRSLQFSQTPTQARLSRDARHVVYESVTSSSLPAQLFFYDVASNKETLIVAGFAAQSFSPSFSVSPAAATSRPTSTFSPSLDDSGSMVLYVNAAKANTPAQIFLWTVDAPSPGRQITAVPEGVSQAVLSGSGNVIYAVTTSNRILRIDAGTGSVQELSGRLPIVSSWYSSTVPFLTAPGSLVQADGTGLTASDGSAFVAVGGTEAFVVGGDVNRVYFQLPWDYPTPDQNCTQVNVNFGPFSASVFDQPNALFVCPVWPYFIAGAVHEDFRGLVTSSDPATQGEILHFYMTGLGPVSPPARTGVTATANPLQYAQPPFCSIGSGPTVADIRFAGLAPGLTGVYQLDVSVPAWPTMPQPIPTYFDCGIYPGQGQTVTSFYYH